VFPRLPLFAAEIFALVSEETGDRAKRFNADAENLALVSTHTKLL
jgi:hypothetical protein